MEFAQNTHYLARPNATAAPGILVLHAWWGLNDDVKGVCDSLAAHGYVAYAPDLYGGRVATSIAEAERLSQHLDAAQASAEVQQAAHTLAHAADSRDIGVMGFSLGAYFALKLSDEMPDLVRAVAVFYGTGHYNFAHARARYLGHFAENDPYEPAEAVDGLAQALAAVNRPAELYRYAGVGHWFCEPSRPDAFAADAAALAWQRTLAFLAPIPNEPQARDK